MTGRAAPAARLRELAGYRNLVSNLTLRDLKLKYKGSVLGILWSLLNPLLMMTIYTVVFSVFLRAVVLPNYWALVLGGILAWTFFASAVASATVAFVRNSNLINKVAFPVEALPISSVLASFVNFVIMLAILLVVLVVARVPLGPSLVLLPVIVLALLGFAIGVGLLFATLTVYFRDLEHLVGLGLTAWFYLTPILYPLDARALPHAAARYVDLLKLNPLTWYLESIHAVLFYGRWPDPLLFALMLASSLVALVAGYLFFAWLRPRIPEEV